ncbi:hypothetical protein FHY05_001647 [Sphingomonas sp. BK580]|nr:hypothetical protein [Sphingomonas sp. BK580]
MTSRLVPPECLKDWALIIRCVHSTGEDQKACMAELEKRGLWLNTDQRAHAGLPVPDP